MSSTFSVTLSQIIKEMQLESIYLPKSPDTILISSNEVNRPGLQLTGFLEHFNNDRIQILGKTEVAYLNQFSSKERRECLYKLLALKPPAVVITRGFEPFPEAIEAAKEYGIPLLRTTDTTSNFMSALIAYLNVELAPRITRHGVLVEVYGEGVLLLGESGVGKSETAIELVKRGHRLIADDAVEIRRTSAKTLVGSAPDNIRHFCELRGIGIINVRRIFGMGAIKVTEKIDLVIYMEQWDPNKIYDRLGVDNEYTVILGIKIPSLTIPIKPGRNLAIIIEVAAMNNRQKKMGYFAAHELMNKLALKHDPGEPVYKPFEPENDNLK